MSTVFMELKRDKDVSAYQQAERAVKREVDAEPDDLSRPAVVRELAEAYTNNRQFRRLENDQRIIEARRAVAQDHNMDPEDVSLHSLLKVTCGAYVGYQQTSDWRPENAENGGFKTEVDDD